MFVASHFILITLFHLIPLSDKVELSRSKNQFILSQCQASEARAEEIINWLMAVEPQLNELVATSRSAADEPEKFVEWEKQLRDVDQFFLRLETQFAEAKKEASSKLLMRKLQLVRNRIQVRMVIYGNISDESDYAFLSDFVPRWLFYLSFFP